jgi:DNA-binding GntR family transcriptional regulator
MPPRSSPPAAAPRLEPMNGSARIISRAYEAIRADIISGQHAAGAHLREEQLADLIGVSRTPVREALRRLAAEGLVDFRPHQGAFVQSWSLEDLRKIFDLRAILESTAAAAAAPRISAAELDRLRELAMEMVRLAERRGAAFLDNVGERNREFHAIIMGAADNERLRASLVQTIEVPIVHRTFRRYQPEDLRRSLNHHRELVDAFAARDGEWAAAVMRAHVLAAKHVMVSRTEAG